MSNIERLTKNNYVDDCFALQNEKNQLPEYKDNHYSESQYHVDLWNKVKVIEDIEEKLGCPIELYYKMCIEGTELYSLPHSNVIQWRHQYIYHKDFEGNAVFCLMINSSLTPLYYVKDYGKTWALTRKELEDDK